MHKLIIGCGYLGCRLAHQLSNSGEQVTGCVRSAASLTKLAGQGIAGRQFDLDEPSQEALGADGAGLFYFAPPPAQGVVDSRVGHLISALEAAQETPRRLLYLSTTGVYGDCQGEWVDETRPVDPQVDRARRRWDAEQQLRAWSGRSGCELVILRVAGIYGPGRLPLARLQRGEPIVRAGESAFTNRIHVDDLVQVCQAAMACGQDGAIYNVSDGQPGTMADYFDAIADRAGLPRPPKITLAEAQQQLSPGMLSYMRESRRLDNRRMIEELGVVLRYPDLQAGLNDCFTGA